MAFTGVINYCLDVYNLSLPVMLGRTMILDCMPKNQPAVRHRGDAHTAVCCLRILLLLPPIVDTPAIQPRDHNWGRAQIIQRSASLQSQRKPERFRSHPNLCSLAKRTHTRNREESSVERHRPQPVKPLYHRALAVIHLATPCHRFMIEIDSGLLCD